MVFREEIEMKDDDSTYLILQYGSLILGFIKAGLSYLKIKQGRRRR